MADGGSSGSGDSGSSGGGGSGGSGSAGTIEDYAPRQARTTRPSLTSLAVWTNCMPQHEPWARQLLMNDTVNSPDSGPEYNVNHFPQWDDDNTEAHSGKIGRVYGIEETKRNPFWKR